MAHNTVSPIVHKGFWYDPYQPKKRWYGELTIALNTLPILDIYMEERLEKDQRKRDVLVGGGGGQMRVMDLEVISQFTSDYGTGGYKRIRYVVRGPIFSRIKKPTADLSIVRMETQIYNRDDRLADPSIAWRPKYIFTRAKRNVRINKIKFPGSRVSLDNIGFDISYGVYVHRHSSLGNKSVTYKPNFILLSEEPQPFDVYRNVTLCFQRYLSFVSGELIYFEEYYARLSDSNDRHRIYNIGDLPLRRKWLWDHKYIRYRVTTLFEKAIHTLVGWFDRYGALEPVLNLFFYTLEYSFDQETEYTILSQALEGFHRIRLGRDIIDRTEYKENWLPKLDAAISTILEEQFPDASAGQKSSVEGRLGLAYEAKLPQRLEELIDWTMEFSPTKKFVTKGYKKPATLAQELAHTRNLLAHRHDPEALKKKNIPDLICRSRFLLALCIMKDIGFTSEEITAYFD